MATPQTSHGHCLSCDAAGPAEGAFCPVCGEATIHKGDLRLRHLTHEFLDEVTHYEGKVWRTIRALLFEPGRLTAEYWAGRRGPWVRPLRIYLIVAALQLLLASNASGPLGLRVWADQRPGGQERYMVGQRIPEKVRASPVSEEVNHRIQSAYLWVRYLSLGLFAAASLAVYRKFQPYYGAHLIFAMHFYSFESIVSGLMVRLAPGANPLIPIGIGLVYLFFALRRIYSQKLIRTAFNAFTLFLAVSFAEVATVASAVAAVAWLAHR